MKIIRIDVFQVDIPLVVPSEYPHKTYEALDDTVVRLETDSGDVGWGEVCPIGSAYQPAHALGVRAAIEEMAPGLIGEDPTQTDCINATMNKWLKGGEYAKSAIDIACWDIVGKVYGKPLYMLLGGRRQDRARAYPSIPMGEPAMVGPSMENYRSRGYAHFQLKVGRNSTLENDIGRIRRAGECLQPGETLVADANKHWKTHEALRVLRATEDVDFYTEQPCQTYEECLSIRRQVRQPMILDECMADIRVLLRALADDAFEGIGCKITRVGGITGVRLMRDVCAAAGKIMTIDDAWGSDLSAATQAHLSVSTAPDTFLAAYISTDFSKLRYDLDAPAVKDGFIDATDRPGLGVSPDPEILGEPVQSYG
ncbi:MAG: enolase C-terminal domain-like protein [Pseudomonadota bacterium]